MHVLRFQGGEHVELVPCGGDFEVNAQNVHDYVRKYAEYRMVKVVSKPLEVRCWFESWWDADRGIKSPAFAYVVALEEHWWLFF